MFKLVLQTVKKQEKSYSLTVKIAKLYCFGNCFSLATMTKQIGIRFQWQGAVKY